MFVSKFQRKSILSFTQRLVLGSVFLNASILHAYEYVEEGELSDEASIIDAIQKGEANLDFRLRYEDARQPDIPEQGGQAITLRSRLSYQTQRYNLFSAYIQFEDVSAIPDDRNYNSGSNGESDDVFIGEPDNTHFSEAWLNYNIANTSITYGRQSYSLNDGRMLGRDDWSQNTQAYTGLSITNQSLNYTTFSFAHFNKAELPYSKYGPNQGASMEAQLYDVHYRGFLLNDFSIYHLSVSDAGHDTRWETKTTGLYVAGEAGGNNGNRDSKGNLDGNDFSLSYLLEFANQKDAGNNPNDYSANYSRIEIGAAYQKLGLKIGYEKLGADGAASFVTPLARMHEYQGSTGQAVDQSIGNIIGGIVDYSLQFSYQWSGVFSAGLTYHDYKFDEAPASNKKIGTEIEARASVQIDELSLLLKYADYSADQYGEDTRRIWLQTGVNF